MENESKTGIIGLSVGLLVIGLVAGYLIGKDTRSTPFVSQTPSQSPRVDTETCVVAGCSGQLCVDEKDKDWITTCEYLPEYICYKTARCERQTTGQCGWTKTPELISCLYKNKK